MVVLSAQKMAALKTMCDGGGYDEFKDSIGTDYQFSLLISDKTGANPTVDCYPSEIIPRKIKVSIRRIVAFDSGYGELILQVW